MGFTYQSYNFIDKDPVVYEVWDAIKDIPFRTIERDSGVSIATLDRWFWGPTKKPQHATVRAVLRAAGLDYKVVSTIQPIHDPVDIPRREPTRAAKADTQEPVRLVTEATRTHNQSPTEARNLRKGEGPKLKPGERWKERLPHPRRERRAGGR